MSMMSMTDAEMIGLAIRRQITYYKRRLNAAEKRGEIRHAEKLKAKIHQCERLK